MKRLGNNDEWDREQTDYKAWDYYPCLERLDDQSHLYKNLQEKLDGVDCWARSCCCLLLFSFGCFQVKAKQNREMLNIPTKIRGNLRLIWVKDHPKFPVYNFSVMFSVITELLQYWSNRERSR